MKFTALYFLPLLLTIAFPEAKAIDTISVRLTDAACVNFMPSRTQVQIIDKAGIADTSYLDSVRVCGTAFDGVNRDYYLVVYDVNGFKRMEGNFHDQFANGHCIHYDAKGRITSEGEYEMVVKRRYTTSRKTGTWKYYNTAGVLIRTEKE